MIPMERIRALNADRLAWCCREGGITPQQLATDVDVSPDKIVRVMAGDEGVLTFRQLEKVADYFGRGVLFFLEDDPVDEAQIHTPQFRTLANQKPEMSAKVRRVIELAERQRDVFLGLREGLDDEPIRFAPPDLARRNIPLAAEEPGAGCALEIRTASTSTAPRLKRVGSWCSGRTATLVSGSSTREIRCSDSVCTTIDARLLSLRSRTPKVARLSPCFMSWVTYSSSGRVPSMTSETCARATPQKQTQTASLVEC